MEDRENEDHSLYRYSIWEESEVCELFIHHYKVSDTGMKRKEGVIDKNSQIRLQGVEEIEPDPGGRYKVHAWAGYAR